LLQYNNRIGTIIPDGQTYRFITNVGNSTSKGLELFAEYDFARILHMNSSKIFSLFHSYSFTDARYASNHLLAGTRGKRVENAPRHIVRAGLTAGYKKLSLTLQYNFVDQTYSDANNTKDPTPNGQTGLIPSYHLTDMTISYQYKNKFEIKSGLNNLFDARYFTRRAGGYPGPGVLPGDGRRGFLTIGFKI
jgi:Fe(3+) dicitrate transport protein